MAVPSNAPAGSVGAQPLASGLSLTDYFLGWQPALFPASSVLVQNSQFIALDHSLAPVTASGTSTSGSLAYWTGLLAGAAPISSGTVIASGGTAARTLAAHFGDVVNVKDFGAVADGQKVFLAVSMATGSHTLTVSMPGSWVTSTAYGTGAVAIAGSGVYSCMVAGTSAVSGAGPTPLDNTGGLIVDGTASWFYLGTAPTTASVFTSADVGKSIFVNRQDIQSGWVPWYATTQGYSAVPTITAVNSATSITISAPGTAAPTGSPTFPTQPSWPYSSTPSVVMWGTDNSAAFQAALNIGGGVFIPDGTYCFAKGLTVQSRTMLFGHGRKAVLMPLGVTQPGNPYSNGVEFISNTAYKNYWLDYESPGGTPGPAGVPYNYEMLRNTIGDTEIHFRDFTIDMSATGIAVGGPAGNFFLLSHSSVLGMYFTCSPMAAAGCFDHVACDDVTIDGNYCENTGDAWSPWAGTRNSSFTNNLVIVPYAGSQNVTYGKVSAVGVQLNCVGTLVGDSQLVENMLVSKNTIIVNGSVGNWNQITPLWIFPDGTGSWYRNVKFLDNTVICHGAYNSAPIFGNGNSVGFVIEGNTIRGFDGASFGDAPIHVDAEAGNTASYTALVQVSCTSGSAAYTVDWPSHGYAVLGSGYIDTPVGRTTPILYTLSAITVGGQGFRGYFPITGVPDANTLTVQMPANASSTQTVAYDAAYAQISCCPVGTVIRGNVIIDSTTGSAQLGEIYLNSNIGSLVADNSIVLSNTASTPGYGCLVYFSGINSPGQPGATITNNRGRSGSVSIGGNGGNNRVAWDIYTPTPVVVDPDDTLMVLNSNGVVTDTTGVQFSSLTTTTYTSSTGTTFSGARMVVRVLFRSGPTAIFTDTTDTATNIVAAIPGAVVGTSWILRISNTTAYTQTIAAGSGVTLTGTATVAGGAWRDYLMNITATGTPAVSMTSIGAGTN